ncbi:MAG: UDP binding domain-containing protein [Myxococcota bacterium]
MSGKRIALWGLAFKPLTDDIRQSPAIDTLKHLLQAGADVYAYDPAAMTRTRGLLGELPNLFFGASAHDVSEGADALLLMTDWPLFCNPDFERLHAVMKQPLIFDGRNQYDPQKLRALGFEYHCIGRPNR